MKHLKKRVKIILGIIIAIVGTLLITTFINLICKTIEKNKPLKPYGQYVQIDGKNMCIQISGNGARIIVLLSGLASPSPVLELAPLTEKLKDDYTVVVVEPFGYGFSDLTDKKRTVENITEEIHTALSSLGFKSYTIMAHSISGLYGLYYANQYPDEVESFVGIDTTMPTEKDYIDSDTQNKMLANLVRFANITGILRVGSKIYPRLLVKEVVDYERTNEDAELLRRLYLNNAYNKTVMNEINQVNVTSEKIKNMTFPKEISVLFFLASDTIDILEFLPELHGELLTDPNNSKTIILNGGHFLHYTKSHKIVDIFKKFMKK